MTKCNTPRQEIFQMPQFTVLTDNHDPTKKVVRRLNRADGGDHIAHNVPLRAYRATLHRLEELIGRFHALSKGAGISLQQKSRVSDQLGLLHRYGKEIDGTLLGRMKMIVASDPNRQGKLFTSRAKDVSNYVRSQIDTLAIVDHSLAPQGPEDFGIDEAVIYQGNLWFVIKDRRGANTLATSSPKRKNFDNGRTGAEAISVRWPDVRRVPAGYVEQVIRKLGKDYAIPSGFVDKNGLQIQSGTYKFTREFGRFLLTGAQGQREISTETIDRLSH